MTDLFKEIHGTSLVVSSVEDFLKDWLKRKEAEASDATANAYRSVARRFLGHLGPRAKIDLNHVTANDVRAFRDGLIGQLSTPSINHELKILRVAINSACRAGLMQANPAIQVENLHEKQKHGVEAKKSRRPFTTEEIQKLLAVADQEWRDMMLIGLYTGQRLGDLSALTWGNLHLAEQELRFVA